MSRRKVKVKSVVAHWILATDEDGGWTRHIAGQQPDRMLSDWLAETGVEAMSVTAPSFTVIGKDDKGQLHLVVGLSVLYYIDEVGDESLRSTVTDVLAKLGKQLPAGVHLGDVVTVASRPIEG